MPNPKRTSLLWPLLWRLCLAACPLLLVLAAGPAHAQWKWRDKAGHITVSDLPPPREVPDTDILARPDPRRELVPPLPASAALAGLPASAPMSPLEAELEARKRAADAARAAAARADQERVASQRADNCRRARGQEIALASGQRIARINAQGQREFLDDQARADELRAARDAIASDCR
ncbi:MAG: DUF4124 domain-containing protein [Burkholderiales bacterium]|nr:DUF4124 domain-containing protein [Burkholderiales bacterium]